LTDFKWTASQMLPIMHVNQCLIGRSYRPTWSVRTC